MNRPAENATDEVLGVLPETPPPVRPRPRDPFKCVLVAMGVVMLLAIPAGLVAMALESRVALAAYYGFRCYRWG